MQSEEDTIQTDTLNPQEREALNFFLQYQDEIQFTLRNPTSIMTEEELPNFMVFLRNLDSALCKSSLPGERILFRGVRRDYSERLLFLLAIPPAQGQEFSPHVLQDPSYPAFTEQAPLALERSGVQGEHRVVFVYRCSPEDDALLLEGKAGEVLFPRNTRWLTTGYQVHDSGIITICLEKFGNPGGAA